MTNFVDFVETIKDELGAREVKTAEVWSVVTRKNLPGKFVGRLRDLCSAGHGRIDLSRDIDLSDSEGKTEVIQESDIEISERIKKRFQSLSVMARATAMGVNRALIISGPGGLGKSYGVEAAVKSVCGDKWTHIKGYIRPTGLYKMLYANRHETSVIVFDDADTLFADETSMNLLKGATDSSEVRHISWLSDYDLEDEEGNEIPKSFEFKGRIIFITNTDFQANAEKGNRMSPHFEAMISRSMYLDLTIKTKRDYIARIKQVVFEEGMLREKMDINDQYEIVKFIEDNINSMRELSLRMVLKIASLKRVGSDWKDLAAQFCMK